VQSIPSSGDKSHFDADFDIQNIKQDVQVGEEFAPQSIEDNNQIYRYRRNNNVDIKIRLHDSFSSHSSVRIVDNDKDIEENKESVLTQYLKRKHKRTKRSKYSLSVNPTAANQGSHVPDDNFKLIRQSLAPMKKRRVLRSKSKSRNSSRMSRSSSRPNSMTRAFKKLKKTEIFYKNEMMNEIRTYIYSALRFRQEQKRHKKQMKAKFELKSFRKLQKLNKCSE
jgi:hypothetical protein